MPEKQYYVYIVASKRNGALYIGVTSDPREGGGSISIRMTWWPALPRNTGYTTWPQLPGATDDVNAAITREKQLKKWERAWKIRLIEEGNPGWEDLYPLI